MSRSLSIAHTRGSQRGGKSTPFSSALNLRVELENRKRAPADSTHSTHSPLLAERGGKNRPPFDFSGLRVEWVEFAPAVLRFNPSAPAFCCINARVARVGRGGIHG